MKASGIVRKMDALGRIVIPMELRRTLDIAEGDDISIESVSAGILLSPVKCICMVCGSTERLVTIDGMSMCRDCLTAYSEKLEGMQ